MSMPSGSESDSAWWGPIDLPSGDVLTLAVGPLELEVARRTQEWRARSRENPDALDNPAQRLISSENVSATHTATHNAGIGPWNQTLRIGGDTSERPLIVTAVTADRPIISLPVDPFLIPAKTTLVLFVSSPIWIALESEGQRLFEVPTQRPSDCWVGPNTGPGHAAYSNRTQCRQDLSELPFRAHRAITPVQLHNRSRTSLPFERLEIAVPFLSLFATDANQLFTEQVDVAIEDDDEPSSEIRPGAPRQAGTARKVADARSAPSSSELGRMLASII